MKLKVLRKENSMIVSFYCIYLPIYLSIYIHCLNQVKRTVGQVSNVEKKTHTNFCNYQKIGRAFKSIDDWKWKWKFSEKKTGWLFRSTYTAPTTWRGLLDRSVTLKKKTNTKFPIDSFEFKLRVQLQGRIKPSKISDANNEPRFQGGFPPVLW